jgi:ABC-type nitrate/sulfonate/bicarbonate transport system substrate-binding protein
LSRLCVALEWFLNPDHLPLLLARDRGWFAEAGLEVEWVEPREHVDATTALKAGDVDIAITEPVHLAQDVSAGADLVGFARFLHTNGGIMVLESSGITRPADLAGKRLQYPGAPGPGGPAIARTMIQADGGDGPDMVPVNQGFHHTDALEQGVADAATLVFFNFEVVEASFRGLKPRMFALKDWGVPDFCQLILVTTPGLLSSREDDLLAFLRVMRRAIDTIRQDPELAREVWFRTTGTDAADPLGARIFAATVSCFTHDFSMSEAYWDNLAAWLVESGQAEIAAGYEQVWTNRLALPG